MKCVLKMHIVLPLLCTSFDLFCIVHFTFTQTLLPNTLCLSTHSYKAGMCGISHRLVTVKRIVNKVNTSKDSRHRNHLPKERSKKNPTLFFWTSNCITPLRKLTWRLPLVICRMFMSSTVVKTITNRFSFLNHYMTFKNICSYKV